MKDFNLASSAFWIGNGLTQGNWESPVHPAPFFRKEFEDTTGKVTAVFSGIGYSELYCNGKKVETAVLDPVVTQYDHHVPYVCYDLSKYLHPGKNTLGVILGNGWYNTHTPEVWHFDKASWRDEPKMILALFSGRKQLLRSDSTWRCSMELGPIRFDGLRNGETYDARAEFPHWAENDFDDSNWANATVVAPPGGKLFEQLMPPCRVMETLPMHCLGETAENVFLYEAPRSMAGWTRLNVRGTAGTKVELIYSEMLAADGKTLDRSNIDAYVHDKEHSTQYDRYILKGAAEGETWEPRFTYHGFRYVEIRISGGQAKITNLEARIVHTAFAKISHFESSSPELNALFTCTEHSYTDNFVGIPTDCPHREKNGWTGDAQLAAEFGMFHYNAASSYAHWMQLFRDIQRNSGQLPGIVPSCGWGFNWGSGPAWDSALFVIPETVYRHTGDLSIISDNYDAMKKYIAYLESISPDHIVRIGLGDWCPVDQERMTPMALNTTAYFYYDTKLLASFAQLLHKDADAKRYEKLAQKVRKAFQKEFYQGKGQYGRGGMTDQATALYFGLCKESERASVGAKLNELVIANDYKVDFGILGAKYTPRALCDAGYRETAAKLVLNREYPGWLHWIEAKSTTLWETWSGKANGYEVSHDHIMFGDVCAFILEYFCGVRATWNAPGFSQITLRPYLPEELSYLNFALETPRGLLQIDLRRDDQGTLTLAAQVPAPGTLQWSNGTISKFKKGYISVQEGCSC